MNRISLALLLPLLCFTDAHYKVVKYGVNACEAQGLENILNKFECTRAAKALNIVGSNTGPAAVQSENDRPYGCRKQTFGPPMWLNTKKNSPTAASNTHQVICKTSEKRVNLHRYYNRKIVNHFYTANYNELKRGNRNWKYEGVQCQISQYWQPETAPLYRYLLPGKDHFYTTNINEIGTSTPGQKGKHGYVSEGVTGYCFYAKKPGTIPLYRYYHGRKQNHFYTTNAKEIGVTRNGRIGRHGYKSEGVACYVYPK